MKTTYKFTAREVLDEVIRLAQERPDFVYLDQPGTVKDSGFPMCSYLSAAGRRGERIGQGCIVGQALSRLGVSDEHLAEMEGDCASSVVNRLTGYALIHGARDLDRLRKIQAKQDAGSPWGKAVKNAFAI